MAERENEPLDPKTKKKKKKKLVNPEPPRSMAARLIKRDSNAQVATGLSISSKKPHE